jgi:SAM-dependent methyltransferase
MKGWIYWHHLTYRFAMWLFYGSRLSQRFDSVAQLIPSGSSVIDLCCGDGAFYFDHLSQKNVDYSGVDLSRSLTKRLLSKGISVKIGSLLEFLEGNPPAEKKDFCTLLGALYHFGEKDSPRVLERMTLQGKKCVLLEPIQNLSTHSTPLLRAVGAISTHVPGTESHFRFTQESLLQCIRSSGIHVLAITPVLNERYLRVEFEAMAPEHRKP